MEDGNFYLKVAFDNIVSDDPEYTVTISTELNGRTVTQMVEKFPVGSPQDGDEDAVAAAAASAAAANGNDAAVEDVGGGGVVVKEKVRNGRVRRLFGELGIMFFKDFE